MHSFWNGFEKEAGVKQVASDLMRRVGTTKASFKEMARKNKQGLKRRQATSMGRSGFAHTDI